MSNDKAFPEIMRSGVYKAIYERRDMRHFNGKPIDESIMQKLFAVAHAAPSVGFMQPWRFIRIKNNKLKQQLHAVVKKEAEITAEHLAEKKAQFLKLKVEGILHCSEVVVVSLMEQRNKHIFGRRTLPEMDLASAACAIQNMWLAARAEGIGLGWVSLFEPEVLAELLAMPKEATAIAILCIGHVDQFYDEPMLIEEKWAQRGDINNYIMADYWDSEKAKQAQDQWNKK